MELETRLGITRRKGDRSNDKRQSLPRPAGSKGGSGASLFPGIDPKYQSLKEKLLANNPGDTELQRRRALPLAWIWTGGGFSSSFPLGAQSFRRHRNRSARVMRIRQKLPPLPTHPLPPRSEGCEGDLLSPREDRGDKRLPHTLGAALFFRDGTRHTVVQPRGRGDFFILAAAPQRAPIKWGEGDSLLHNAGSTTAPQHHTLLLPLTPTKEGASFGADENNNC